MDIKQQVCSLDLAKRLKELGVKQDSFFSWEIAFGKGRIIWPDYHQHSYIDTADVRQYYAAFTVAELGEMLPHVLKKDDKLYFLQCNANGNSLRYMDYTTYDSNGIGTFLRAYPLIAADTEANARAAMLAYLLENNFVKV